ncbi:MAG TPA: undecaprenyl-diphosphate phosphatase [Planktothrix sp.]|jgi:undecaprenyl-diphosphatase
MADSPIIVPIVLGIVQGLTEFLPISSSAHLRVVPAVMHWTDPGVAYDAVIQLGSVVAVITYFAKDLIRIASGSIKGLQEKDYDSQEVRLAGAIVLGTIPICVVGFIVKHLLEQNNSPLRSLSVVAFSSIFMGLLLLLAERLGSHKRSIDTIGGRDGLLVGLGQCMAVIPGCSRSGSTLTVAMLLNLKREDAARFSFLLGIPAIVISGLVEAYESFKHGMSGSAMSAMVIGLIASTIVSYAAIAWFLKFLQKHSTYVFVCYRLVFGIAILILSSTGFVHEPAAEPEATPPQHQQQIPRTGNPLEPNEDGEKKALEQSGSSD